MKPFLDISPEALNVLNEKVPQNGTPIPIWIMLSRRPLQVSRLTLFDPREEVPLRKAEQPGKEAAVTEYVIGFKFSERIIYIRHEGEVDDLDNFQLHFFMEQDGEHYFQLRPRPPQP